MIKGKLYLPYDNSYCENVETGADCSIVPIGIEGQNEPLDCRFEIVSEPYEAVINSWGFSHVHTFVNVKSNNTGRVYRTLFNEGNVYSL